MINSPFLPCSVSIRFHPYSVPYRLPHFVCLPFSSPPFLPLHNRVCILLPFPLPQDFPETQDFPEIQKRGDTSISQMQLIRKHYGQYQEIRDAMNDPLGCDHHVQYVKLFFCFLPGRTRFVDGIRKQIADAELLSFKLMDLSMFYVRDM